MTDHRTMFYVIRYLGRITKEPFTVRFGKASVSYIPPQKVEINQNFFQSAICRRCGECCQAGISMVATKSDIEPIVAKMKEVCPNHTIQFEPHKLTIEKPETSYEVDWWVTKKMDRNSPCELVFHDEENGLAGCKVQAYKALNCWIPLLYIGNNKGTSKGFLTKRMHGKLWVPKCKARFEPFSYSEFLQDVIILKRLQQAAEDFGISTWMPEIIEWCEGHSDALKDGWLPSQAVQLVGPEVDVKGFF